MQINNKVRWLEEEFISGFSGRGAINFYEGTITAITGKGTDQNVIPF